MSVRHVCSAVPDLCMRDMIGQITPLRVRLLDNIL